MKYAQGRRLAVVGSSSPEEVGKKQKPSESYGCVDTFSHAREEFNNSSTECFYTSRCPKDKVMLPFFGFFYEKNNNSAAYPPSAARHF